MTARKRASFGSILLTVGSIAVVASCAGESSQDAAVTPLRRDSGVACVDTTAAVGTAPRALDSAMDQALQTHGVAGCAIAIVKRGRTVLAKGYGIATPDGELETARRVHLLASASKPVTAVALMQLVEAGKLRLDDDVNTLLHATGLVVKHPAKPRAPITVRMLLTHTAGIGDSVESYDPTWFSRGDSSVTLRDFVVGYFTPGSRYSGGSDAFGGPGPGAEVCYSNMGVALLSLVVEVVAGEPFADYARRNIFAPLGMTNTSFLLRDQCDASQLSTTMVKAGDGRYVPHDNGALGQPEGHPELASGMLRSTAVDMAKFVAMLAAEGERDGARVLRKESVREIARRQVDASVPSCNARAEASSQGLLGYFTRDTVAEYFGHAGGMNGVGTDVFYRTADGAGFVVLCNESLGPWINDVEIALLEAEPSL